MLSSFCKYQATLNPSKDGDLGHWDVAILVTGLDMHVAEVDKGQQGAILGDLFKIITICYIKQVTIHNP